MNLNHDGINTQECPNLQQESLKKFENVLILAYKFLVWQ